jgi:hypothetical protein
MDQSFCFVEVAKGGEGGSNEREKTCIIKKKILDRLCLSQMLRKCSVTLM